MSDKGQMSKVAAVRFERLLPGPIERVWDYLTKAELLSGWFGNGEIEARVGGKVSLCYAPEGLRFELATKLSNLPDQGAHISV